jgi:hypothetical protein
VITATGATSARSTPTTRRRWTSSACTPSQPVQPRVAHP